MKCSQAHWRAGYSALLSVLLSVSLILIEGYLRQMSLLEKSAAESISGLTLTAGNYKELIWRDLGINSKLLQTYGHSF